MKYSIVASTLVALTLSSTSFADDATYSDSCGPLNPIFKKSGVVKKFSETATMAEIMSRKSATFSLNVEDQSDKNFINLTCRECNEVKSYELKNFPGIVNIHSNSYTQSPVDPNSYDVSTEICGGTLIHKNYILTAAHCLDPNKDAIEIYYGSVDYEDKKTGIAVANTAHCMRGFEIKAGGIDNDLALIDISDSSFDDIRKTLNVKKIPSIANISEIYHTSSNDILFTTAGWGLVNSTVNELGQVNFEVTTSLREGRMKFNKYTASTVLVSPHLYNGGTSSICGGDSGGPLYWKSASGEIEIVGVVSTEITAQTCQKPNDAQFVNIYKYKDWLEAFPNWD